MQLDFRTNQTPGRTIVSHTGIRRGILLRMRGLRLWPDRPQLTQYSADTGFIHDDRKCRIIRSSESLSVSEQRRPIRVGLRNHQARGRVRTQSSALCFVWLIPMAYPI